MRVVDCCGLQCPQPVIEVRKAMMSDSGAPLEVIVDNTMARDNILILAQEAHVTAEVSENGGRFHLVLTPAAPGAVGAGAAASTSGPSSGPFVVVLSTDRLGQGDEELGRVLMRSFLFTLKEGEAPNTLVLLNRGVYLAAPDSPVLELMQALHDRGTHIVACGTCLDYYHLKEHLAVGSVTNMAAIVETMSHAGRTITW